MENKQKTNPSTDHYITKLVTLVSNSSTQQKKPRETKFVADSSLDISVSENQIFRVAEGKLHTGNNQQVGLLRTLLKSIPNGIFVHRAVRETKSK